MKELIAIIQDIPVAHQSLIFCNSTLDDRQSLGAAGVADGDTLTLVLAVNTPLAQVVTGHFLRDLRTSRAPNASTNAGSELAPVVSAAQTRAFLATSAACLVLSS